MVQRVGGVEQALVDAFRLRRQRHVALDGDDALRPGLGRIDPVSATRIETASMELVPKYDMDGRRPQMVCVAVKVGCYPRSAQRWRIANRNPNASDN